MGNVDGSNSEPRNIDTKKIKLTLAGLKKIKLPAKIHVPYFTLWLCYSARFQFWQKNLQQGLHQTTTPAATMQSEHRQVFNYSPRL